MPLPDLGRHPTLRNQGCEIQGVKYRGENPFMPWYYYSRIFLGGAMRISKVFFYYGVIIMTMVMTAYPAYSETGNEASGVTKLVKKDNKIGAGNEAVAGKLVDVHYTGWLYDPATP